MKKGFTTGSAATAAAKAAAYMLLSGKIKDKIEIITPAGIVYNADIVDIEKADSYVKCAVIKDGGDDPDVTNGAYIYAKVSYRDKSIDSNQIVSISGGKGVGVVTKPGLDQKVGNAAINSVPREMIINEVSQIIELFDYEGSLNVEISVPMGEEIAKKTFNPRLGIEGGISIIGTSGIVEPMSTKALLDTIHIELKQRKEMGFDIALITPGNYGRDFMQRMYDFDIEKSVKCSNFIGDTIDMASDLGFSKMLITGHIGKLIKVSGGIMNTHSKEADCRMELLASAMMRAKVFDRGLLEEILNSVTTDEAIEKLSAAGVLKKTMDAVIGQVMFYLNKRAAGRLTIECIIYSNEYGLLCKSDKAEELIAISR